MRGDVATTTEGKRGQGREGHGEEGGGGQAVRLPRRRGAGRAGGREGGVGRAGGRGRAGGVARAGGRWRRVLFRCRDPCVGERGRRVVGLGGSVGQPGVVGGAWIDGSRRRARRAALAHRREKVLYIVCGHARPQGPDGSFGACHYAVSSCLISDWPCTASPRGLLGVRNWVCGRRAAPGRAAMKRGRVWPTGDQALRWWQQPTRGVATPRESGVVWSPRRQRLAAEGHRRAVSAAPGDGARSTGRGARGSGLRSYAPPT